MMEAFENIAFCSINGIGLSIENENIPTKVLGSQNVFNYKDHLPCLPPPTPKHLYLIHIISYHIIS
jgi:hypothetical protein